jgi:predicted transcriptional regulator
MTLETIQTYLDATCLCGEDLRTFEATSVFSSDMMSDVLAYGAHASILITGLHNAQVVRTAEMLDMACIIFVCGRIPAPNIVQLAKEKDIVVLSSQHDLFTTCGILYQQGLRRGDCND